MYTQYMQATSPRMWFFLFFAFVFPIIPTLTEVVSSVSECQGFLLDEKSPEVPGILQDGKIMNQNRYKAICQTYNDQRRYLTLYDTENKIPVFSAYKYRGTTPRRPNIPWMIEPQLEGRNTNDMWDVRFLHQACDDDYKHVTDYNRGHLFPNFHAFGRDDKKSTFTLTNTVPQAINFNNCNWQKVETCTKCILERYCINNNNVLEGFVVTGAVPSMNNRINNRVNIPIVLWSAFCCYSHSGWLAGAHWGNNTEESETLFIPTITLEGLYQMLRIHYPSEANSIFEVFPGTKCPLDEIVAEKFPKTCQCPPPTPPASILPTTTTKNEL